MIIYRVEELSGYGPYRYPNYMDNMLYNYDHDKYLWSSQKHNDANHPTPGGDGIDYCVVCENHWKCGFSSLEQLFQWFLYRELRKLLEYGYNIVRIDIDKKYIKPGGKQVVFNSEKVKSSHVMPLAFARELEKTSKKNKKKVFIEYQLIDSKTKQKEETKQSGWFETGKEKFLLQACFPWAKINIYENGKRQKV